MTRLLQKLAMPVLVMVWSTVYFIEVLGKRTSAQVLVKPVFYVLTAVFLINAATDILDWRREEAARRRERQQGGEGEDGKTFLRPLAQMLICVAAAFVYMLVMPAVGFSLSTVAFLFLMFCYLKTENKLLSLGISVALTAALYVLFKVWLRVPLFPGFIGF